MIIRSMDYRTNDNPVYGLCTKDNSIGVIWKDNFRDYRTKGVMAVPSHQI